MPKLENVKPEDEDFQTVEFQTYQGLQRVVRSKAKIFEPLITLLDWLDEIQYRSTDPTNNDGPQSNYVYKRSVRLLDTFLLGSMRVDILQKLIEHSRKHDFEIQILLLDPYSPLARLRSRFISDSNDREVSNSKSISSVIKSLNAILEAVDAAVPSEELTSRQIILPDTFQLNEAGSIGEQIELINLLREHNLVNLEIKFYSEQTEVPVYIISRFVAKGLIFPQKKASKNPWMIFADDKTQSDDVYDNLSDAFDDIWLSEKYSWERPKAEKLARSSLDPEIPENRRVFVVHGHDDAAKLLLVRYLKQLELEPIILAEQPSQGRTIIENFEENADVGYAIILLTPDDIGYAKDHSDNPQPRARQNVILELGYFIGQLSRTRVCALLKGSIEIPSDYHGVTTVPMKGDWKFKLKRELEMAGFDVDLNSVT